VQLAYHRGWVVLQLAFPHDGKPPSQLSQCVVILGVSRNVSSQFWFPVILVCRWNTGLRASGMLMPKAPLDLNDCSATREYQIWGSWKACVMEQVPIAKSME
jgi:hypothetical protein